MERKVAPHSFGRYIYINRDDYQNGLVPDEILIHEWAHVRQHHSYDLLFIELLITFCWFNPVFYLYRNKIKQNHEYLADEAVVGNNQAIIRGYFDLLISQIPKSKNSIFISNFNFINTKKRIVMMTKTTSKKRVWCSIFALIPVFIVAVFVFSTKTVAQNEPNTSPTVVSEENPMPASTADLLQEDKVKEYQQILEKHYRTGSNGIRILTIHTVSKEEIDRLHTLYLAMSPEQRSTLTLVPQRRKWVSEKIPTKEQFESWKSPTEYGVWLDGVRIENSELNRYQPTDFSNYFVSRLARNAKNYGKHVFQLDLYSTAQNNKIKAKWDADETLYLMTNTKRPNP
jgi:hypothetical protein